MSAEVEFSCEVFFIYSHIPNYIVDLVENCQVLAVNPGGAKTLPTRFGLSNQIETV